MPPKRDPVPRAKDAWVWLGGILMLGVLGAGFVVAAVMLWENVDIRRLTPGLVVAGPLPEPLAPAPAAVQDLGFAAVVFNSARNRTYFPDPTYYDGELARWRDLVSEAGGTLRDATDAQQLRTLAADEVLLLVEAPCLSPAEAAAVRAHVARGGSLVSNWAVGVRDASCAWRGWATLLDLTDAADVRELPSREGLFMTVPGGIGLSAGIDPGTRIELRPDPSIALRMTGQSVYWSDWALNPAPDEAGFGADVAAITARTPEGGRTAWFGLRLGQPATPADSVHLRRLVQNGVRWAAGVATASAAAWPGGARAALVFSLDVEDQPRNALDAAALFEAEELPATFYVVSRLVGDDEELANVLARVGEVGSHTSDHARLGGLTGQDQAVRLRRSWSDVERWTGTGPSGLRPPEEAFDSLTLGAWQAAGGRYLLARNESRSASPEIHRARDGVVVVLPRLLKDDYNVVVQDHAIRAERIGEAFVQGTRKMRAIGGVAVVAGHTQIMLSGRRLDAFRAVADTARAQGDWWIARADEVAEWWRARAEVRVSFVEPDTLRREASVARTGLPDILVQAGAEPPTGSVWIDVVLPRAAGSTIPLVDGRSVEFEATDWGLRVPVGSLAAGDERRVSIVLVVAEDGRSEAGG